MSNNQNLIHRIKPWFGLWLPVAMLTVLPVCNDYLRNRYQISVQDMVLPLVLALVTATIISLVFFRFWQRDRFAAYIAALLTAIVVANNYEARMLDIYGLLHAFSPLPGVGTLEGLIFSLAFLVLIGWVALQAGGIISRWTVRRGWKARDLMVGIALAITATFALQFIPVVKDVIVAWPQFFYRPPQLTQAAAPAKAAAKPDIYYIELDDYTSQDVLKNQLGYDNSSFTQFLQDNQYYVNQSALSNYPYTTQSVASTLNAGYLSDMIKKFSGSQEQTIIPYHQSIKDSAVVRQLKSLGYTYDLIGTWYDATNSSPLADMTYQQNGNLTLFGHKFALGNFASTELSQSVYWRFIEHELQLGNFKVATYTTQGHSDMTLSSLSTLKNLAGQPPGGRFIFAHILSPHDEYFFNPDGSISPYANGDLIGKTIQQKYTDQVQFINSQIKSTLSLINQNSHGQAVVVLQADEGPYPIEFNSADFDQGDIDQELNNNTMLKWSLPDLQMKYGILAAYHIPAATSDELANSADAVNVFRLILNKYFDGNLPILPRCYYAYPRGRDKPFVYNDITKQLTGEANPACSNDGSG